MSQEPNPEVRAQTRRRQFSAEYKKQIIREAAACAHGELGSLLRREGLYHSQLTAWRKAQAAGELQDKARGPKPDPQSVEIARLERENERLQKKLAQAEAIIEAQKKLARLMEALQSAEETQ